MALPPQMKRNIGLGWCACGITTADRCECFNTPKVVRMVEPEGEAADASGGPYSVESYEEDGMGTAPEYEGFPRWAFIVILLAIVAVAVTAGVYL